VDSREQIFEIINIFIQYPPLTYRMQAQLHFLLECEKRNNVEWYLQARGNKYLTREQSSNRVNLKHLPVYFNEWLSGFIEAEGCFCIRKKGSLSFSIGQKHEKILLDAIKTHFNITNKIYNPSKDFWVVETYKSSTLHNIIQHCSTYPLLGQKNSSLNKFKTVIK